MRKVVVLIESSRAYGRGLLRGVSRYTRECGPWSMYVRPHGLGEPPPPWLKRWDGDGLLVRIGDRRTARAVLAAGKPAVDLRGVVPGVGVPFLGVDNRAVSDLAAGHLLERGLRQFAFFGPPLGSPVYRDARREHFVRRVEAAGYPVHVYSPDRDREGRSWEAEQARLTRWVRKLPKPVGVMASRDDSGFEVLDACRRAGVRVPDDVAVIGVDDDELLCLMSHPPLTSIHLNPERVGYEAAALLDRLMAGDRPPADPVLLPPRGVVPRQSTDVLAVDDPDVAEALGVIRRRACDGLRVGDLAGHVAVSLTALERRFRAVIGRSPKAEITRVRLERAKQLLSDTLLPIDAVAAKTGFRDACYLCDVFAKKVGVTPKEYRVRYRR